MRAFFIGKPLHWALWIVIVPALAIMGLGYLHVRNFNGFMLGVLLLGAAAVAWVLLTTRAGEAVTREPISEGDWQQAAIDE
jgi:hypothetical protein